METSRDSNQCPSGVMGRSALMKAVSASAVHFGGTRRWKARDEDAAVGADLMDVTFHVTFRQRSVRWWFLEADARALPEGHSAR